MNKIQTNNKAHQESLDVVDKFIENGGKINVVGEEYKSLEWKGIKPKKHLMPDNRK